MKSMLGLAVLASLALALPASAAEHGKKHAAAAEKPATAASTAAVAPAPAKKDTKKATP